MRVFERGEKGRETLGVVVGVGVEWRLGRWKKVGGARGRTVFFEVPRFGVETMGGDAEREDGLKDGERIEDRDGVDA